MKKVEFCELSNEKLSNIRGGEQGPEHGQDEIGYYYKIYNEETGEYEYWSMGDFA